MHEGFRQRGDDTCSCCPAQVSRPGGTLCALCLKRAAELAANTATGIDTVVVASMGSSTWHEGNMYRRPS